MAADVGSVAMAGDHAWPAPLGAGFFSPVGFAPERGAASGVRLQCRWWPKATAATTKVAAPMPASQ